MLATKLGAVTNLYTGSPLSNSQLYNAAPSIFAADKHSSRSNRYTYIPTITVIEALRKEGFLPFSACQSKSRIPGKAEFTKHMIRLRKGDHIYNQEANEVVLLNAHDGTSSFQMLCGMFRFVCQNGMVTGDIVDDIRVHHRGNIVHNVIEAAYDISEKFLLANVSLDLMKSTHLN